jgi:hypothetical protein
MVAKSKKLIRRVNRSRPQTLRIKLDHLPKLKNTTGYQNVARHRNPQRSILPRFSTLKASLAMTVNEHFTILNIEPAC